MSLIMPVITVQMIIELNSNTKVRLMNDNKNTLWQGMLYDVPDEYRTLEVEYVGWLFKANCHYIIVWG